MSLGGGGAPHVLADPCRGVASEPAPRSAPPTRAPIPPPPGPPRGTGTRAVPGPSLQSAWVGQVRDPAAAPRLPTQEQPRSHRRRPRLPPPRPPPNLSLTHLLLGDAAEASAPGSLAAAAGSARPRARSPRRILRLAPATASSSCAERQGPAPPSPHRPTAAAAAARAVTVFSSPGPPAPPLLARPRPRPGPAPRPLSVSAAGPAPAPPLPHRGGLAPPLPGRDPRLALRGDGPRGGREAPPLAGTGRGRGRGCALPSPRSLESLLPPSRPCSALAFLCLPGPRDSLAPGAISARERAAGLGVAPLGRPESSSSSVGLPFRPLNSGGSFPFLAWNYEKEGKGWKVYESSRRGLAWRDPRLGKRAWVAGLSPRRSRRAPPRGRCGGKGPGRGPSGRGGGVGEAPGRDPGSGTRRASARARTRVTSRRVLLGK